MGALVARSSAQRWRIVLSRFIDELLISSPVSRNDGGARLGFIRGDRV